MKKETYMKILSFALLRLEETQSLCTLDTIMRIDETGTCEDCVFKDAVEMLVCPGVIEKKDVRGLLK